MKTKHHIMLSACAKGCTIIVAGFACLICISLLTLAAPSVEAACPEGWNIGGNWGLKQQNQDEPNSMNLTANLDNGSISGTASYSAGKVTGNVTGSVNGEYVHLEIAWSNRLYGYYDGKVNADGTIRGTAYEVAWPNRKVYWFSTRKMVCRQAAAAPVKPKPVRSVITKPSDDPSAAADAWLEQERAKRKAATPPTSTFQPGTPTPTPEANESSSSDTEDQHQKNKKNKKKNKKKHHQHDEDDENQGND